MPDLPTISVTQGQYDRLLAVFEGTAQEKAAQYRAIVREALRQHVIDSKTRAINEVKMQEAADAIAAELADPDNL